jgi:hypothetical protein
VGSARGDEGDDTSSAAGRSHWAFEAPARPPLPEVANPAWARAPVDRFILAALDARRLRPVREATRGELARRASFDLLGLPPEPEAVETFEADESPDAFSRLADRLLASPRYGERWARHWFDVARYADSNGLDENVAHGNAWRYRDWVVAAFNRDQPFDEFVVEQLAGDLLPSATDDERRERRVATGFLALGPKVLAEGDERKMELDIIDEQVDTVGRTLLGLTLGCARCHDHKFDPVATEDYYALAGVFKSTRTMESFRRIARWYEHSLARPEETARREAHEQALKEKKAALEAAAAAVKDAGKAGAAESERLKAEVASLEKSLPELPGAMGVTEGEPRDLEVHVRGSYQRLGKKVARGVPAALRSAGTITIPADRSGRLELARWIVSDDHPLTARVFVNRIWRWRFGRGIVATPDNFGLRGERPSHPELLDFAARRLVELDGSVKALHRELLLTSVYRLSSEFDAAAAAVDPEDRLLWRWGPRRLEAEALRDAMLAVSGRLDLAMGGSLLHVKNREFFFDHTSRDTTSYSWQRRSLYLPVVRNHVFDALEVFDFPDPAVPSGDRASSTLPSQALFLLNSELVWQAAAGLAERVAPDATVGESLCRDAIDRLYRTLFSRRPLAEEVERALEFLVRFDKVSGAQGGPAAGEPRAWAALCQALLGSSEFLYVR